MRDLLREPCWRAEDLGLPLPDDPHAVSVALPRWRDAVGYEEGDEEVLARLRTGYPRFVFHPLVRRVMEAVGEGLAKPGEECLVFPGHDAAADCAAYLARHAEVEARVVAVEGSRLHACLLPTVALPHARRYWQHGGRILSSRHAAAILEGRGDDPTAGRAAAESLRRRLAGWYRVDPGDVFLHPNGMAAFYALRRAAETFHPGRATVQFGFPYVDLLKVQERFGSGARFVCDDGEDGLRALERVCAEGVAAVTCEVPGNPLLRTPDCAALRRIAADAGALTFVDDTVASPYNVDALPVADAVVGSLTKWIAGSGDVMGGSVVLSPDGPHAARLRGLVGDAPEDEWWWEDLVRLEERSRDFPARMARIDATAAALVSELRGRPGVAAVHYPPGAVADGYEALRRPEGGYGGLFSLILADGARRAPVFYDALPISKGPSLGTDFSLACPYTILAHYDELEWARSCGVPADLVRVSVGLEPLDELRRRFDQAFAALAAAS